MNQASKGINFLLLKVLIFAMLSKFYGKESIG